jgi:hypothetical protein
MLVMCAVCIFEAKKSAACIVKSHNKTFREKSGLKLCLCDLVLCK